MKIAIMGYSGTGKSTLAQRCGLRYGIPVLHLDTIGFLPDWQLRPLPEQQRMMREFLDGNDQWVIEGNYGNLEQQRRLKEADQIILLEFNRFASLFRAWKRTLRFRNQERKGHKYRRYREIESAYPGKVTVIRNQRQMNEFMRREGTPAAKTEG